MELEANRLSKVSVATSYVIPVTLCLIVSLGFVGLFTASDLSQSLPRIAVGSLFEEVVWTVTLALCGLIGVTGLYWLISHRRDFELRLLMAIVVAPTSAILLIVFTQTILMVFAKVVSSLLTSLIVLASLYVAIFSVIFILTDAFSTKIRNGIFIIYGAMLGSFVSLLIPTTSLIVLLLIVAFYDLVMLNFQWIIPMIRDLRLSRSIASRFGYVGERVEVGMGELIFYSFLPAHVEAYYSPTVLILTVMMTLTGVLLNLWMLTKKEILAGLPAPIFLGLIPLILSLAL
jgi:hypothetical protein